MIRLLRAAERVAGKRVNPVHRLQRLAMRFERTGVDSYDASIDPYELVSLSPAEITKFSQRVRPGDEWRIESSIGDVRAGTWDTEQRNTAPHLPDRLTDVLIGDRFEDTGLYRSFVERYRHDVPWEETPLYAALVDSVSEFPWHGCRNQADVDDRMAELDALYRDIRDNGYRAHTEATGCDCIRCLSKEVAVDLARDGTPLFVAGRHRLSIAKILDLETIPVVVVVRHHEFLVAE